jgi:hypothetical protein
MLRPDLASYANYYNYAYIFDWIYGQRKIASG